MNLTTRTVSRPDGTALATVVWRPDADPTAVVQIAHGMAEHALRYAPLAARLTGAGYAVWAHDHRGHGQTAGTGRSQPHLADRDGWQIAVDDLRAVRAELRREHPGLPVFLLGHSMGSSLARTDVLQQPDDLAGLVLSGVSDDPGVQGWLGQQIAGLEARLRGPRHPSALMASLTFGRFRRSVANMRTKFDWLSRDAAVVDAYVADPLCGGRGTARFFHDLLEGVRLVNRDRMVARVAPDLPILILAGDADPVGGFGQGAQQVADQLRRHGVRDLTLRRYPEARHEVFNEINRDAVIDELLDWLDAHR